MAMSPHKEIGIWKVWDNNVLFPILNYYKFCHVQQRNSFAFSGVDQVHKYQ